MREARALMKIARGPALISQNLTYAAEICRSPIETSPASPIEMSRFLVCLRLVEVADLFRAGQMPAPPGSGPRFDHQRADRPLSAVPAVPRAGGYLVVRINCLVPGLEGPLSTLTGLSLHVGTSAAREALSGYSIISAGSRGGIGEGTTRYCSGRSKGSQNGLLGRGSGCGRRDRTGYYRNREMKAEPGPPMTLGAAAAAPSAHRNDA